jgi:Mrp family chromosome partitioning ATPase
VLQTNLIADIPVFGNEKLATPLPTTEAPESAAAEAFRFVATGIELRQHSASGEPFKSVVVASATLADGKTTVTANTAFAAARSGRRIALIDADFVNPALTRMLAPEDTEAPGLTDVVAGEANLGEIGIDIAGTQTGQITLFRRGTHGTRIPEFFASARAANLIKQLENEYDLVLIDAPPVLRLAHSGTVVRLADRVMIVVAHRSDISVAEELQHYLSVVGVPVLGYVYNFAPLRREMLGRSGSNSRSESAA